MSTTGTSTDPARQEALSLLETLEVENVEEWQVDIIAQMIMMHDAANHEYERHAGRDIVHE